MPNKVKLVKVETFGGDCYWTLPNEIDLKWNSLLNEAEFELPKGFTVCKANDGNLYFYDSEDFPVKIETRFDKTSEGEVFILTGKYRNEYGIKLNKINQGES